MVQTTRKPIDRVLRRNSEGWVYWASRVPRKVRLRLTPEQEIARSCPKRYWRPWMVRAIILNAEGYGASEIARRVGGWYGTTKAIHTKQNIWRFLRREDVGLMVEQIRAATLEKIAIGVADKQREFIDQLADERTRIAERLIAIAFGKNHADRDALRAIEMIMQALGDARPKEEGSTTNVVIAADLLDRYQTLTHTLPQQKDKEQGCRMPSVEI